MSELVPHLGQHLVMHRRTMLDLFLVDDVHPDDKMIFIDLILRHGHGRLLHLLAQSYLADEAGYH